MREILFRGKRTENGEWIEGFYAKSGDSHFILIDNSFAIGYVKMKEVVPETVGQYTGLIDKNCKKIFEGDIVVTRFTNGQICVIGDIQFAYGVYGVEWTVNKENKGMIGCFGQLHNLRKLDDDIIENIEVIGNKWDNPELLKQ